MGWIDGFVVLVPCILLSVRSYCYLWQYSSNRLVRKGVSSYLLASLREVFVSTVGTIRWVATSMQ